MDTAQRPWFVSDSGFAAGIDADDKATFMRVCPERVYRKDEAFLEEGAVYAADAVVLDDTVTCPMSRAQFLTLARQAPTFALSFAEVLAKNLFQCRDQLAGGYAPIKIRVARALLEQARRYGAPDPGEPDGLRLDTELRHEEIAGLVGATRVSVSTAVAELRSDGFLEGTRGRYRLHAPALEALEIDA